MKIFYSWQSDSPRRTNKNFIYQAFSQAIEKLKGDVLFLDLAERELILDQDTQGVLGSPEISRVIFEKIAASNIVAADVSLVARGTDGKKHINSNVAIELGYAYGILGDKSVLKVMNTFYGEAEQLPFDLRNRRHPIQYCLPDDADRETIRAEKNKLAGTLTRVLGEYLRAESSNVTNQHGETPSTQSRGVFWNPSEAIVQDTHSASTKQRFLNTTRVAYFRCIPAKNLFNLTSKEAFDKISEFCPLYPQGGWSRARNRWGAASYKTKDDGDISSFTQLFKNGEIWGVDSELPNLIKKPTNEDEQPKDFFSTPAAQREYPWAIERILACAKSMGYGEYCIVELGLARAAGIYLPTFDRFYRGLCGPIYADDVFVRTKLDVDTPVQSIMTEFWTKLYQEAGREVPDELLVSR